MFNLPALFANRIAETAAAKVENKELPLFVQKRMLRDEINNLSKMIAKKNARGAEIDWSYAHKKYAEAGGRSIEVENLTELKCRKDIYLKML
jgi:hypothetical protein